MQIMIVCGEASGDYYGASLIKAIKESLPKTVFYGFGGPLMESEGLEVIFDPTQLSVVGFTEALKLVGFFKKWLKRLQNILILRRPDCLVLIDFPGFNMRLAKIAHGLGISCVYFVPPSAWAWGQKRAKKVAQTVDAVAAIMPMDLAVYQAAGANIEMVGHPLLEEIPTEISRETACRELDLDANKPVLALLPGSRNQEIKTHLKLMLEAAKELKKANQNLQVILALAASIEKEKVINITKDTDFEVVIIEKNTHQAIAAATACLCTCGTVTLEAALLARPMVSVYKLSILTALLTKLLVKVKYYALPNIILNERVVVELIHNKFTVSNMVTNLEPLLVDTAPNKQIQAKLRKVRPKLGSQGAYTNTAKIVLEVARGAGSDNN